MPEIQHVFVNVGTDIGNKQYKYIGMYEALRVDKLTVDEWLDTPEDISSYHPLFMSVNPESSATDSSRPNTA